MGQCHRERLQPAQHRSAGTSLGGRNRCAATRQCRSSSTPLEFRTPVLVLLLAAVMVGLYREAAGPMRRLRAE